MITWLFIVVETEESLFLLATCYYRAGQVHQAHWLLSNKGTRSAECRYLMARCALELKQYSDAECYLSSGSDHIRINTLDEIVGDFGDIAGFALQLIAKICQQTERGALATESSRKAIKLNPFLFNSYIDLCSRGEKPDPQQVFQITNDTFQTSQAAATATSTPLNTVLMGGFGGPTTDLNVHNNFDLSSIGSGGGGKTPTILTTPVDQQQQPMQTTPTFVHPIDDTPLHNSENTTFDMQTPFRKQFKYLTSMSPNSPSFGVLPLIHTPSDTANSPLDGGDLQKSSKKLKSQMGSVNTLKEQSQAKQPTVLGQMANIAQQPKSPAPLTGQNVRRSTRLFSNNYSVKENNKSPNINKFAAPRSPPRKSKQRSKVSTMVMS